MTPTFVYRAIKGLPLVLENEGRSSRDFIYVDDVVKGLMLCATNGRPGEVYNLASGVETTIRQLADEINALVDSPAPLEIGPRRPWDRSGNRLGSTTKASEQLGFSADVGLREGIRRTVDWTKANLAAIDAAIERHRMFMTSA